MVKIALNGFGRLGMLTFRASIDSDLYNYIELKDSAEKVMQKTLPTVFVPRDLFETIPPMIIFEQEIIHQCIIKPTDRLVAKLPITENLALAENIKEIAYKKPTRIDIDTRDLPKERYHDRTFPKNFYKKKKKKRRMQKQSRRQKYL